MLFLHLCKHSSVDFHFSQCPCQSICNKNKETTSQPLPEKYSFSFSHILWENIPSHYGNLFPSSREYFPKQSGMFSHNMREYFPTIYGTNERCNRSKRRLHSFIDSLLFPIHYEKWMQQVWETGSNPSFFTEKLWEMLFQKSFLIIYPISFLSFTSNEWEYEKWNSKIFSGRRC